MPLTITGGEDAFYQVASGSSPGSPIADLNDTGGVVLPPLRVWIIDGGADAARFTINSTTGELFFNFTPDFNNPQDSGGNNVYDVIIRVFNPAAPGGPFGPESDTQRVHVTVAAETGDGIPHITTLGGGDTASVDVDAGTLFVVDANASDSTPGDSQSWFINDDPSELFTIDSATGVLSFIDPPVYDPGGSNSYVVEIAVEDGDSNYDFQTITITVVAENLPPVAANASITLNEDASIGGTLTATDPEGDTLTYAIATGPLHGTISNFNAATGTYTYTPTANYNGSDTFTFRASDGTSQSASATVSITVAPVADPLVVSGPVTLPAAQEDQGINGVPIVITRAQLLANASDADGNAGIAVSNVTLTSGTGTLTNNGDGTWTYAPVPFDDTGATFSYTVTSGPDSIATTATLDIIAYDNPPVVSGPVALPASNEDTSVTITSAQLLANATDIDSANLTVFGLNVSRGLNLVNNGNGTWTYTPHANDVGDVTFSYEVRDGVNAVFGTATLDLLPVAEASPGGAEIVVNQTIPGDQRSSDSVILADGRTVVVWWDLSAANVKARIYAADGTPATGEFVVGAANNGGRGPLPDVIALSGGGFAIGWSAPTASGHLVQLYGSTGTTIGSAIDPHAGINSGSAISLLTLSNGEFEAAYTEAPAAGGYRAVVRSFDASGAPTSTATPIDGGTEAFLFTDIQLALRPDGGFIAAFERTLASPAGQMIFRIASFDSSGVATGPGSVFGPVPNGFFSPPSLAIAVLDNGNYVATWSRESNATPLSGIRAQIFSPIGVPIGAEFTVNTYTSSIEGDPRIAALDDGGFVIVWSTSGGSGGLIEPSASIRFQQFSANGSRIDAEQVANVTTNDIQFDPSVSAAVGRGFLISWTDRSENTPSSGFNPFDVRMRYFGTDGGGGYQNHAPVVSGPVTFNMIEGGSITLTAAQLLANASDVDAGDVLSVVNVTVGPTGVGGLPFVELTANANGTFTVSASPNFPDYTGAILLRYSVFDGTASVQAQANGTITAVDDPTVYRIDYGTFGGIYENDSVNINTSTSGTIRVRSVDPDDIVSYTLIDSAGGRFAITTIGQREFNSAGTNIGGNAAQIRIAPGATLDYETAHSYTVIVRATTSNSNIVADIPVTINVLDVQETGYSRVGGETVVDTGLFGVLGLQSDLLNSNPQIIMLNNGNRLVVWNHLDSRLNPETGFYYQDRGTHTLFGQQFSANGTPIGSRITIAGGTSDFGVASGLDQLSVVPVGLSGFNVSIYVSQSSVGVTGDGWVINNYTVSNSGTVTQSQIDATPAPGVFYQNSEAGNETGPDLIALLGGGFAVVYSTNLTSMTSPAPTNIYVQRYTDAGAVSGAPVALLQNFTGSLISEIKFLQTPSGAFVLGYLDGYYGQPTARQMHLLFLDSSFATTATAQFALPSTSYGLIEELLQLPNGTFLLTYNLVGGGSAGQIIDQNGNPLGSPINFATGNNPDFDVQVLPDGGFVVAWNGNSTTGGPPGIRAQRYSNSGQAIDAELVVSATAGQGSIPQGITQYDGFAFGSPHVTALGNQQFSVTWVRYELPDYFRHNYDREGSTVQVQTFSYPAAPNTAPVATNGTATGNEDTAITGVLAATDADGNALTYAIVTAPTQGNVVLTGSGYSYTPNLNSNGADSFTFRANDGTANSNIATVSLTVTPVNDAPTATGLSGDIVTTTEAAGAGSVPAGVLIDNGGNTVFADVDNSSFNGGTLRFAITAGRDATQDRLSIDTSGIVSIVSGVVSVGGTVVGTVTGGGAGGGDLIVALTANATPVLVQSIVRAVVFTNTGGDNPTPGARTITMTLTDGGGTANNGADTLTVTSTVNVVATDDPAIAGADTGVVTEGGLIVAANVFGNDSDPDGPALAIASVNGNAANVGTQITLASGALLTVNANGTYSYNPNGRFDYLVDAAMAAATGAVNTSAVDSFTYGLNGGGTATVTVTVNGVAGSGDQLRGNPGNNTINGTPLDDYFDLSQGGNDSVTGGAGNDAFFFGAAFTALDSVDGGAGTNDQIGLQGDYATGLTLGANALVNVEVLSVLPGFSYSITSVDANVAAGQDLSVFGGNLGAGDNFTFDGSAETNGRFRMYGGLGTDIFTGGALDDGFYFGPGKWGAGDSVTGGGGTNDQLALDGNYTVSIGANADVETLVLLAGPVATPNSFNITLLDAWTGAGATKTVWGAQVTTALTIDGSAETNGNLIFFGGSASDTLTGGAGNDTISGGRGGDALTGGGGNDIFRYDSVADSNGSTSATRDRILDFTSGSDKIDLSRIDAISGGADDAFAFIGSGAFTNVPGQLRFTAVGGGVFNVEGDVDGDGIADFAVLVTAGTPLQATDFVL